MIENISPSQTWEKLSNNVGCVLVDVRTRAEWGFVGVPDLSELGKSAILIEWKSFPAMQTNENFVSELLAQLEGTAPSELCFLCRSGQRSMAAATLMQDYFDTQNESVECFNIAEGFEGDLNPNAHRGVTNGWKARGLSWRQS